jgi:hypothetical protein
MIQPSLFPTTVDMSRVPIPGPFITPRDQKRLGDQQSAVTAIMERGLWVTLAQVSAITGYPEASVSARIRCLRQTKFGGRTVERRRLTNGQWEYRLAVQIIRAP